MKATFNSQYHLPVTIRKLSITTMFRLHPEFMKTPVSFARRNKVDLADEVFTQTDFRKNQDDPGSDERIKKLSSNIHLVRHGAIRLYAKPDEDDWLVHCIELNPSKLLYAAEKHRLREGDLPLSLSMLKAAVSPLLAEPLDARHIVPGLVQDGKPVAFWSLVDSELLLPGINIRSLHGLSHPLTGPAEGAKKNRIQLGDKVDNCWIRFKKADWMIDGSDGPEAVKGVRVRLVMKSHVLASDFMQFGGFGMVAGTLRLVTYTESGVGLVHQAMMARLEGTQLPVPAAWLEDKAKGRKNGVTHAKVMALASRLTTIPLEDIRAMDEEIRHPSESTHKRLNDALPLEISRLTPVPVATLFNPAVYVRSPVESQSLADDIDPVIADAYGEK